MVSLAKSYCDDPDEAAATFRGGSFAEYAMISLHGLRIFLDETYEMIIDRLDFRLAKKSTVLHTFRWA